MANHVRKFDWDEAKRLRAMGFSVLAIADTFGVSTQAVRFAIDDEKRIRFRAYHAQYQRETKPHQGTCPDCGGISSQGRYRPGSRCRDCETKHKTTSVRPDTLRCSTCRLWLPDEEFPLARDNNARRQRHALCRPCQNVARALNRADNRERERAYERKRRLRATS